MKTNLFLYFLSLIFIISFQSFISAWTQLYSIKPNDSSKETVKSKQKIEWTKIQVPEFSQLIFSWNSFRPKKGYFSFWAQVRDSKTKKWYPVHEVARWGTDFSGKNLQKSLTSKSKMDSKNGTEFHYVRLELPVNKYADAFKIQIKPFIANRSNTASAVNADIFKNLGQIMVNTVNIKKFSSECRSKVIHNLPSVFIDGVPKRSQMTLKHPLADSLCSPTSVSILVSFLLKKSFDPVKVAQGVYDQGLGIYGSWPFNIAHAFELTNGKVAFHIERLSSFKALHSYLLRKTPVIVSVRGPLSGSATPYAKGHLLVVVGFDKKQKKVLCNDPAFSCNAKTAVKYNIDDFLRAWERSHRLSYVAIKV